jgi:signal transduction histidine kinase
MHLGNTNGTETARKTGANMEVEITDLPELTGEQAALIDMHSVVNIMNVLLNELEYLHEVLREGEKLQPALDAVQQIHLRLRTSDEIVADLGNLLKCEDRVMEVVHAVLEACPDADDDPDVKDSVSNLQSVFAVLDTRARELLDRVHAPEKWTDHNIKQLTANFTNVLAAIEKNSKGRYRIVHNIAEQERKDYMVTFGIESVDGTSIHMPPVLQDVMRDLIANARKYTEPGGEITAGLVDNGKELRFVVEDTGRGIPSDEVQQVVEFGKRGSNVDDKATMGGGFGLTKAYLVTQQFGGRMWIASQSGAGTRITISIPRPAP